MLTKIIKGYRYLLFVFFVYFILQLFLSQNYGINSDEGTHLTLGLFYKDLISNLKNFRSFNDMIKFTINYMVKYPKISIFNPPLYHLILAFIFFLKESLLVARSLSIFLTILTSFFIYRLSYVIFEDKKMSLISSIAFLIFSVIFYEAGRVMVDITQALFFTIVLAYYVELKKRNKITVRNLFFLAILLCLNYMAKFFSVLLPIIIFIDSIFINKKFFYKILVSLLLSVIIFSPYILLYYDFGFHLVSFGKAVETHGNSLMYFDVFRNFGVILGTLMAPSIIYFLFKNKKNKLILIWLIVTFILLFYMKNKDPRFGFILMPIYAMSFGYSYVAIEKKIKNKNIIAGILILILFSQLIYDLYLGIEKSYQVEELLTSVEDNGNILLLSDKPVYYSVFVFYAALHKIQNNVIPSCVFWKYNLTNSFLKEWGVRYVIDQNNTLTKEEMNSLGLKMKKEIKSNDVTFILLENKNSVNKVDCSFVCALGGKLCSNQSLSEVKNLIKNNIYILKSEGEL